jgi:hypothetical protein
MSEAAPKCADCEQPIRLQFPRRFWRCPCGVYWCMDSLDEGGGCMWQLDRMCLGKDSCPKCDKRSPAALIGAVIQKSLKHFKPLLFKGDRSLEMMKAVNEVVGHMKELESVKKQ